MAEAFIRERSAAIREKLGSKMKVARDVFTNRHLPVTERVALGRFRRDNKENDYQVAYDGAKVVGFGLGMIDATKRARRNGYNDPLLSPRSRGTIIW